MPLVAIWSNMKELKIQSDTTCGEKELVAPYQPFE